MTWIYYLLEANLYLLVFFAFYLLLLSRDTFYNRNRMYLLGSSLLAFIIPVLEIGVLKPIIPATVVQLVAPGGIYQHNYQIQFQPAQSEFTLSDLIMPIYGLVAVAILFKLIHGVIKIVLIYSSAKKYRKENVTIVKLDSHQTAFSFMNWLFINPDIEPQDVIFKHELIHIKQKHTWDVLLFEIIQSICWFNPVVPFIKKEVKILHEYIADELATAVHSKHEYAMLLIENSLQFKSYALANQFFNQSILKRRIIMLNKEKTKGWARLKLLVALPLAGGMLCLSTMAFTAKHYGYLDVYPKTITSENSANITDSGIKSYGVSGMSESIDAHKTLTKGDQKFNRYLVREVLAGQHLFVNKLEQKAGNKAAIEAKTQDAFKVMLHDTKTGESYVELDWSLIPSGYQISFNDYNIGSDGYEYIGKAIIAAKKQNEKLKLTPYRALDKALNTSQTSKVNPQLNYTINRAKNEILVIKNISENKTLTVHDKWGNVVFDSKDYKDDWNGRLGNFEDFRGQEIKSGSYYYIVNVLTEPTKNTRGYILVTNGESEFEKKSALKPSGEVYYAAGNTDTQNKMEEITIVGSPSQKVQGIKIIPPTPVSEVVVEGKPRKRVNGVQINEPREIQEIRIVEPSKTVQGFPISTQQRQIKEITIQAKPSGKSTKSTGAVKGIEIKPSATKQEPKAVDAPSSKKEDQIKIDLAIKKAIVKEIDLASQHCQPPKNLLRNVNHVFGFKKSLIKVI